MQSNLKLDTDGPPMLHQSPTCPSFKATRPSIRRRGLKSRPWPTGKQIYGLSKRFVILIITILTHTIDL